MPKTSAPQRRIETRASNKTAHPGNVVKTRQKRSKAEVQEERTTKAKAKADREEARRQGIHRAAEFERADVANEDLVDATPRPLFTPKRPRHQSLSDVTPLEETSDAEMSDTFGKPSPGSLASENSDAEDTTGESDVLPPPSKRRTPASHPKTPKTGAKKAMTKVAAAKKRKDADESDAEIVHAEAPQEPKSKKVKSRTRDEINVAAKKIEENESQRNRYADMMESISGT